MSDGQREAKVAAGWWAGEIAAPTAEQVAAFRAHLEAAILHEVVGHPSWQRAVREATPGGVPARCFGVDNGPDRILVDALTAAGLPADVLPSNAVMWVDPGSVRVSRDYDAPVEEVLL